MGIHDKHRMRLRARFLKSGLRDFDEHTALELLLSYAIPRRDTNDLAHRLIDRFGGFDRVLEAPHEQLCEVEGIGERSAALIKLVYESLPFYERCRSRQGFTASSTEATLAYSRSLFAGEKEETAYALCLDSSLKLIRAAQLSRGTVSEVAVSVRKIVEAVTLAKASGVILAHNHPGGYPNPSPEDIVFTRKAMHALALIDVALYDHVIVGERSSVSMADAGLIENFKRELGL
ncbi:MAG: DNA repair protein RadC [Oscillospiraceae bacterium]|nr:DNA repair protein RadC [Oscillospiraceae bacterium]